MQHTVTIEEPGALDFLVIPHTVSFNGQQDPHDASMALWDKWLKDGSAERLKQVCGADSIYALFCNQYSTETKLASYDLACRCDAATASAGFRRIHLRPLKYAVFSCDFDAPMTTGPAYKLLDDAFWGEWLPQTNYRTVLDFDLNGEAAQIDQVTPPQASATVFSIKIWNPIEEKDNDQSS
jgi:predicted transcriptional regulator YdeE